MHSHDSNTRPKHSNSSEIERAIEVFVKGFCAGKSATHPYECLRVGQLWVMRDAARKNAKEYRKEEWVAYHVEPGEVDRAARSQTRGRFFVCAVHGMDESDEGLRKGYKELGYRLLATEGFFVHRLAKIPRCGSPAKIELVRTAEMASRLGKATRSRPIPSELLPIEKKVPKAPFRQYVALDGETIVGWVRSVVAGHSTWVSNMAVQPTHRRRGIGSAMLAKMLRDDRAVGVKESVLLASHAGALLYPRVGYERIGTLLIFAPRWTQG